MTRSIVFFLALLSSTASAATITNVYHLLPQNPFVSYTPSVDYIYRWPGACLSCSTQSLRVDAAPPVAYARAMVFWTPRSQANSIQLVIFRDGLIDMREIGNVYSNGSYSPAVSGVDVTAALNAAISEGGTWHLGWRVRGDPSDPPNIYGVKIEVDWAL